MLNLFANKSSTVLQENLTSEYNCGYVMIGPCADGQGGISRVITNWKISGIFDQNRIIYLPTVCEQRSKILFLFKAYVAFLYYNLTFADIVYIHTASFHSFYRKIIFAFTAVILKKRIILHIHPNYFYYFISRFNGLSKKIVFWLLNRVNTFVVLTFEMQNRMQSLFPGKPIYVLRNPVDLKGLELKRPIMRENNRLLFLGWYTKSKGVYDLVDAAEILKNENQKFVIDFYGTKEIDQLIAYVKSKRLSGLISVHGWADDSEKIVALHKSTALILPSHTEGIPNVILEAMATKTPVVSTLVGGLKEILRDGENAIIIKPENPRNIAEKIKSVLHNPALRQTIAERAYQEALEKYSLSAIKDQLNRIISSN